MLLVSLLPLAAVRAAWPDHQWAIEDLIAEGDRVVVRLTSRATHRAAYGGIAPTGRPVAFGVVMIYRIASGRIAEQWGTADDLGRPLQLGASALARAVSSARSRSPSAAAARRARRARWLDTP